MTTHSSRRRASLALATAVALVVPVAIAEAAPGQTAAATASAVQADVESAAARVRFAEGKANAARSEKVRTASAHEKAVSAEASARSVEKRKKSAYSRAKAKAAKAYTKAKAARVASKKATKRLAQSPSSSRAKARATARARSAAYAKARAVYTKAAKTRTAARSAYRAANRKRVAAVRATESARKAAVAAARASTAADAAVKTANAALDEARNRASTPSTPSVPQTLVAKRSAWSYRYSTTAPANGWQATTAAQPGWIIGTAGLGWGAAGLGTTINRDAQKDARAVTFRRTFSVSDPSKIAGVKIDSVADDGIVLFVNGVEVKRQNMISGEIDTSTYANSTNGGTVSVTVPGSQLKAGTNVIAASVHKNYRSTPSLQFDASVTTVPGSSTIKPDETQPGEGGADTGAYLDGWGNPVWRDEFNGTSVDKTRWNVKDGTWMSYDQAVVEAENVRVEGGELKIRTEWLDKPVIKSNRERHFSTGYIETIGKFSQKYGRWEMRASLPLEAGVSKGIWPAFWLRDSKGSGEIDIMEAIGDPHDKLGVLPAGAYTSTIHESTGHEAGTVKIEKYHKDVDVRGDAYHVYAFEWTPAGMTFLYDGRAMWTATTRDNPWFATSFTGSGVNIRINTQVGEGWMGFADPTRRDLTKLPVDYKIDYVRVWAPKS